MTKSRESVVRVALSIDRSRYEFLLALAALLGKSAAELVSIFLSDGLNHPRRKLQN